MSPPSGLRPQANGDDHLDAKDANPDPAATSRREPTVGIAGGHGGIGSLFARMFAQAGIATLLSDRETSLSNAELAARSDIAFVAVPLHVTSDVLAEMAIHVRRDAALVSLGSLMEPAAPSGELCAGEFALLHPLLGPGRKKLRGSRLALASIRGGPRVDWLVGWLRAQGADVVITTPAEHDRTMAVAQALLHGSYAALAPQIARALPGSDPLAWSSPTLRLQLALMSRILYQDPRLYGDLLALNRYAPAAVDELISRLTALRSAMGEGPAAVATFFSDARAGLGPYGPSLAGEGDRALGE